MEADRSSRLFGISLYQQIALELHPAGRRRFDARATLAAAGAPQRSREDLEAAGLELPNLNHKSSFGDRPVHYLIPDMPPPSARV